MIEGQPRYESGNQGLYIRAAKYPADIAMKKYAELKNVLKNVGPNSGIGQLSAYRINLGKEDWYVVALGSRPVRKVDRKIGQVLKADKQVELPEEALRQLYERSVSSGFSGDPWIERHYENGVPISDLSPRGNE